MVEITYQMVLITLQTIALIVGIAYYLIIMRNSQRNQEQTLKTRNAMVFHQIVGQALTNKEAFKNVLVIEANPNPSVEEYLDLWKTSPEYRTALYWFWQTYEICGIYLKKGIVDVDIFAQYQPYWNLRFWEWYKEIIYEHRKSYGPSYYRNMEYLMNALKEYIEEHPELGV
jgi:hypothetical protein